VTGVTAFQAGTDYFQIGFMKATAAALGLPVTAITLSTITALTVHSCNIIYAVTSADSAATISTTLSNSATTLTTKLASMAFIVTLTPAIVTSGSPAPTQASSATSSPISLGFTVLSTVIIALFML
jgi:hypothetical protein